MDQIEHKKLQILSQFIRSQFLRKFTKLLLSLSVFSLFFSHSSCISMLHSFSFYFQTLPFKLISHNIDKNCIFLFCNGLLVFLAKFSGLISSPSSEHHHADEAFKGYGDVQQSETIAMESEAPLLETVVVVETENGSLMEETENEQIIEELAERETEEFATEEGEEIQEQEGESGDLMVDEEQEDEDEDDEREDLSEEEAREIEGCYTVQEVEEEEREEGNGLLSTDELNKKFDEFIRKMKEELRIEARQQLIMV